MTATARTAVRPGVVLLVAGGAAACGFEFTGVGSDTPASLHVAIDVVDMADSVRVTAVLDPGLGLDGQPRGVLSELHVLGTAMPPATVSPDGHLLFSGAWNLAVLAAHDGVVGVVAPALAGVATAVQPFLIHVPRRGGPAATAEDADGGVTLRIDRAPSGAEHAVWRVDIHDEHDRGLFTATTHGEPPAEIVIPAAWLPDATVVNYRIRITVQQAFSAVIVQDRYMAGFSATAHLHWTVAR